MNDYAGYESQGPSNNICIPNAPETLETKLNVEKLCEVNVYFWIFTLSNKEK